MLYGHRSCDMGARCGIIRLVISLIVRMARRGLIVQIGLLADVVEGMGGIVRRRDRDVIGEEDVFRLVVWI